MWPVPNFSHMIASSSPAVVAGVCGNCGAVSVVYLLVMAAAITWRISMRFLSLSV